MTYQSPVPDPQEQAFPPSWQPPRVGGRMLAYFLLSLPLPPEVPYAYIGHVTSSVPPSGREFAWAVTAFFAWRVSRGGRFSRMLLIIGTLTVYLVTAFQMTPDFPLLTFGKLALCIVQLRLLLGPAVFERTRPWDRPERALRTQVRPPMPVLLLGVLGRCSVNA